MTKFTPGPWTIKYSDSIKIRCSDEGYVATLCHLKGEYGKYGRRDSTEAMANARLIAAAPEMYAALAGIMKGMEDSFTFPVTAQNIRSLLNRIDNAD